MKTRSQPGAMAPRRRRAASRISRRALLRTTADPTRRLAVNPKRLYAKSLRRAQSTSQRLAQDRPFLRTFWNCSFFRRRYVFSMQCTADLAGGPAARSDTINYTVRRLRPFNRRARSTRRPPFVLIRARKPWTRRRRLFFNLQRSQRIGSVFFEQTILQRIIEKPAV